MQVPNKHWPVKSSKEVSPVALAITSGHAGMETKLVPLGLLPWVRVELLEPCTALLPLSFKTSQSTDQKVTAMDQQVP